METESKPRRKKTLIICAIIAGALIAALFVNQFFQFKRGSGRKSPSRNVYIPDVNTDRAPNGTAVLPVFSAQSGFFDGEFELEITADAGEIYYTVRSSVQNK